MRALFIPLAKLLGVFVVLRSLFYIASMFYTVFYRTASGADVHYGGAIRFAAMHAPGLLVALLLIFKTEKIADILKMPRAGPGSVVIDLNSVLRIGLVLIGVGALMYAIPALIGTAVASIQATRPTPWPQRARFWASILQTGLGTYLILQAHRLAPLLHKQESKQDY